MSNHRPRIMKHPGRGARAQYRREYKHWLDANYRVGAIRERCLAARASVNALRASLPVVEIRLNRKTVLSQELATYISYCVKRMAKLERKAPKPPPIRSWTAMRSLEMKAYRKQLRSFDEWDDKMQDFVDNISGLLQILSKLASVNSAFANANVCSTTCPSSNVSHLPYRRSIVLACD